MRVRIEELRFPGNVVAGCNFLEIAAFAYRLRGSGWDPDPIEVIREPDGSWRIHDGRHRSIAAIIAGRPDVLAVDVTARELAALPCAHGTDREGAGAHPC